MPKTYKATGRVTIGGGDIYNSTDGDRFGGFRFQAGDTAELTEPQYKKYAAFFEPSKKQKTENNKEAKTARNK